MKPRGKKKKITAEKMRKTVVGGEKRIKEAEKEKKERRKKTK